MPVKYYFNGDKFISVFGELTEDNLYKIIDTYGVKVYTENTGTINIIKLEFFCEEMIKQFIVQNKSLYNTRLRFRSKDMEYAYDRLLKEKIFG
jgi:hypothetical protein